MLILTIKKNQMHLFFCVREVKRGSKTKYLEIIKCFEIPIKKKKKKKKKSSQPKLNKKIQLMARMRYGILFLLIHD